MFAVPLKVCGKQQMRPNVALLSTMASLCAICVGPSKIHWCLWSWHCLTPNYSKSVKLLCKVSLCGNIVDTLGVKETERRRLSYPPEANLSLLCRLLHCRLSQFTFPFLRRTIVILVPLQGPLISKCHALHVWPKSDSVLKAVSAWLDPNTFSCFEACSCSCINYSGINSGEKASKKGCFTSEMIECRTLAVCCVFIHLRTLDIL